MDTTRIFSDIAADRTCNLARRIRCVIEPVTLDSVCDGQVGHARLGHDAAVGIVHLEYSVELAKAEQHRVRQWQSTTGKRCAGAARHHLYALLAAIFHHCRDLVDRFRKRNSQRQLPVGGQPIGIERLHALWRIHQRCRWQDFPQSCANLIAATNNRLIGIGHQHRLCPDVGIALEPSTNGAICQRHVADDLPHPHQGETKKNGRQCRPSDYTNAEVD